MSPLQRKQFHSCTQIQDTDTMANPKYADLPGIAYDQPDLYETNDLPESEQGIVDEEEQSEYIERLHLNAPEAYAKFKGKWLDGSKADFSDVIGRHRSRKGYDFITEYEMVGEGSGETETLLQKYQRLQTEIAGLSEDIQKAKDEQKSDSQATQSNAVVLDQQLSSLQQQFSGIRLEQIVGDDLSVLSNLSDPEGVTYKKLLSQLDTFKKQTATSTTKKAPEVGKGSDQVVYELMYKPESAHGGQTTKVADVEHRLQKLESLIGSNPEKASVLTGNVSRKSLLEIILHLNAKMNLLDPAHLDQIDGRLTALSLRLGQLTEKRSSIKDSEEYTKIQGMYELLKKAEATCAVLPDIVNRLVVLKDLHEQALQFSKILTQLDASQQQITRNLENCHGDLKEARTGFASNLEVMKRNLESLEKRMATLKK